MFRGEAAQRLHFGHLKLPRPTSRTILQYTSYRFALDAKYGRICKTGPRGSKPVATFCSRLVTLTDLVRFRFQVRRLYFL